MKKYIIILIASLMATASMAQDLTEIQKQKMRQAVWEKLNEYVLSSQLRDEEEEETFLNLFADPSMDIYNDLMGYSAAEEISVEQYVTWLKYNTSEREVILFNVRQLDPVNAGNTWQMRIEMDKAMTYTMKCTEAYLNSVEYYQELYHIGIQFAMDVASGNCFIIQLEGKRDGDIDRLDDSYTVLIQKTSQNVTNDVNLTIEGKPVKYNDHKQLIIPGVLTKSQMDYRGAEDFYLSTEPRSEEQGNVNVMYVQYQPKPWRVKLYGDVAFASNGAIASDNGITFDAPAKDFNIGIDIGYSKTFSKFAIGLFAGVNFSQSTFNMKLKETLSFTDLKVKDEDGDYYDRHYEGVTDISQTLKVTKINIPVYVDLAYRFNKISPYIDLGAIFHLNMNNKISEGSLKIAEVYGQYKYNANYGNIRLPAEDDTTLQLEGFGRNKSTDIVNDENLKLKTSMSFLIAAGLRYDITKRIGLEAGIQYQLGLNDFWSNSNPIKANDENGGSLIHYSGGQNGQERVDPLLQMAKSMRFSAPYIHIGLIFAF